MNDEELEQLLKRDRAVAVLDEGFTERSMAQIRPRSRASSRKILMVALLSGILLCLLLPSGVGNMLVALQHLMEGTNPMPTFLLVLVPLLTILTVGAVLMTDET